MSGVVISSFAYSTGVCLLAFHFLAYTHVNKEHIRM